MYILTAALAITLIYVIIKNPKKPSRASKKAEKSHDQTLSESLATENAQVGPSNKNNIDFSNAYTPKWIFSYNEKDAFKKIKSVTDKMGYHLLAKVRLYDLLEPKKNAEHYKTLQYKIQAKHVDFVICDEKLVARTVIELDDTSHNKEDRKERDEFVDKILTECGYKVLRYRAITPEILERDLQPQNCSCPT